MLQVDDFGAGVYTPPVAVVAKADAVPAGRLLDISSSRVIGVVNGQVVDAEVYRSHNGGYDSWRRLDPGFLNQ